MNPPNVSEYQWIRVGKNDALVLRVYSEGKIEIGYYQNGIKAIGEDAVWNGSEWVFKYEGLSGRYLRGSEESAVKRGPIG